MKREIMFKSMTTKYGEILLPFLTFKGLFTFFFKMKRDPLFFFCPRSQNSLFLVVL